jgi:serine protease inhibitor
MMGQLRSVAPVLLVFATLFLTKAATGDPTAPESPPSEITEVPRSLTLAETEALRAGNNFGLKLLRRLYAERADERANVFISPLSVSMSLGMLMNGAGGETFSAMGDALGLNGVVMAEANEVYKDLTELLVHLDPNVEFRVANNSWLEEGFRIRLDYRSRLKEAFDARIESVRFEESDMAGAVNGWVGETTEGRITDLATPEEFAGLVALLVNTVYFKGEWTDPFDPAQTVTVEFRRADGSTMSVPLMGQALDARVGGGEEYGEGFVAVDLPYGGDVFSMVVVVPTGDATLAELVEEMDGARWQEVVDALRGEARTEVRLPRFELTYEKVLNDVLKAMGMEVAFDASKADFGWMVGNAGLRVRPHIGWVKQKSFLKVDEEGTETAAATGTAFATSGNPVLQADRPFLFAIRERLYGTILFIGTVSDPTG